MLKENLLNLGFTNNQAEVYLALLEMGQTKVGPLIKKLGFHRNIIYRALDDLEAKKLIYKINKKGIIFFNPTDPSPLLEEIKQKEELAKQTIKEIKKLTRISPSEVLVFTGEQGIKDLANLVLKENEDLYLIGANGKIDKRYQNYFRRWEEKRIEKNIKRWHLATKETKNTYFNKLKNLKVKYLPELFSSPMVIWIFGRITAHVIWEKPETIFLIKNKKIADDYRKYFKLLWQKI